MDTLPKSALQLIKKSARPYRSGLIWFFVLSGLGIAAWAASPFAIRGLINELSAHGKVTSSAKWLAAGFVVLRLFDEWLWRISEYVMRRNKPHLVESVRSNLFSYTLKKPYNFFVNSSSGQLGHWINQTTNTVNETVDTTIWGVWPQSMGLIFSGIFLMLSHWVLALIFIVWLGVLFTYTIRRGRKFGEYVEKESQARSVASGVVVDALSNHLSVRVFNARRREEEILNQKQKVIIKRWSKSWGYHIRTNLVKGHSIAVAAAAAFAAILWLFSRGQITVGDVALFISYFTAASSAIWELAWQLDNYYRCFGTINNALNGLSVNQPERIVEGKHFDTPASAGITLKNLEFSYPDQAEQVVLKNVSLQIKPGERVGIVGHSGAGKTTLIGLLLGFYQPTSGEFKIAEQDVNDLDPSQMRDLIAFVPQDTNLFNRTVAENIAYASTNANLEQIKQAAADAQALDFINKLPQGFDTVIGERGVKLSGGQRQRIAIARALLKNAPILLLDEATSALDSVSEQAIQKAFNIAMKDRTAVVVAHRLSTLRHMDRIVVFDGGTIAEQGSHEQLVKLGGIYADLWRRQKDGFIAE